jgi:hypothetical protein
MSPELHGNEERNIVENSAPTDASSAVFRCDICSLDFQTKLELAGHKTGKHRSHKCSICGAVFENQSKIGHHKIEIHGYTRKQLGWDLNGGWNKGLPQMEAFGTAQVHHGNPEFMRLLNSPSMIEKKKSTRRYHEEMVLRKEKMLRAQGFKTFNTSNYTHHTRIPDIIAISSDGKIIAVEMETIRKYKSSVECLTRKYRELLMREEFFDDVIVEGFLVPDVIGQDSNTFADKSE